MVKTARNNVYGTCVFVGGAGAGVQSVVRGFSRMIMEIRIPTIPERSTSGFHHPGRHCLHQPRRAMERSAGRMKGELHHSKNRS